MHTILHKHILFEKNKYMKVTLQQNILKLIRQHKLNTAQLKILIKAHLFLLNLPQQRILKTVI